MRKKRKDRDGRFCKSLPTKMFLYGAKQPIDGLYSVAFQMRLAHDYKNEIIQLERQRRERTDNLLRRLCPELLVVEATLAAAKVRKQEVVEKIKKIRAAARKRIRVPEHAEELKSASTDLSKAIARRKELRAFLFALEEYKKEDEDINAWEKIELSRLDKEAKQKGLDWGSRLQVVQSLDNRRSGAPPEKHDWDWHGHITVQTQNGLAVPKLFLGKDTRIRVEPVSSAAWVKPGRHQHLRRTKLWFRIGSDENKKPIWAVVPFTMHRQMPEDGMVKWVHLIRNRISSHCEWSVMFTVSRASGWVREDCATEGRVGIDVGWRMRPDGSLRVAYWSDTYDNHGELILPPDWMTRRDHIRKLQSDREKTFNEIRERFLEWLKLTVVPEWLQKETETLSSWKSHGRLINLIYRWRRFAGDEEMLVTLEVWRRKEHSMYEEERNLEDKLQNQRKDIYRKWAADLRRTYKTAVIEKLDLRTFHKLPSDSETKADPALKEHVRDACLSVLRQCIRESMMETIEAPPEYTTMECHNCGSIEEWDHKELCHTCSECSENYDQDYNAALNLRDYDKSSVLVMKD